MLRQATFARFERCEARDPSRRSLKYERRQPKGSCRPTERRSSICRAVTPTLSGASCSGAGYDSLTGRKDGAVVVRFDPLRDLAVLTCDAALPEVAGELTATGQMKLRTEVSVTGLSVIAGSGHTARSLTTIGRWTGPAMWEKAVPTGRMTAEALMPGMSGAPVIRDSDGAVAGVVSGRYNSADGWLAGTVWVVRTEDLLPLLAGIATVTLKQLPLAGPVDLLLTVTESRVQLTGPGIAVAADHNGVRSGLAEAVNESRRARARVGLAARAQTETGERTGQPALGRASRCWRGVPARADRR